MHVEQVEIYSDATNAAILRHPDRRFPGVLVQGDTLWILCCKADALCADSRLESDCRRYDELNEMRNTLRSLLDHYKAVLDAHNISLPFHEKPVPIDQPS